MTALRTRRPSGKPPWPMLCIAGVEKSGKSYGAALFSACDLIDRTFYLELGEGAADQYGSIPGARYEIVEHDGTYRSILEQLTAAVNEPRNGRPHAIVIDSVTELWDLLSDEAQAKANARAAAKAAEKKRPAPAEDVQITMDLWNDAKKKWRRVLDIIRVYDGPVILLARLELVAVMEGGKPTEAREWKIRAEKNLPYECDAIVRMTAPQTASLTGVRSTVVQVPPGRDLPLPGFTIEELLRRLGLDADGATAPRSYTAPRVDIGQDEPVDRPMTRQPRSGPADDEWSEPPRATDGQLGEIAAGLRAVRGVAGETEILAAVSELIGRQITAGRQLAPDEADRVLTKLRAEDAAQQATAAAEPETSAPPGPTPDDPEMVPAKQRMMHGLFKTAAGITDSKGKHDLIARILGHEIETMAKLTRSQGDRIILALSTGEIPGGTGVVDPDCVLDAPSLRARIERAQTSDELADVSEDIWRAKDLQAITEAEATTLLDWSMDREAVLSGRSREAREAVPA